MASGEFLQPIGSARRPRTYRLIVEIAAQIGGEFRRSAITALSIAFECLQSNPFQIAMQLLYELLQFGAACARATHCGIPFCADSGAQARRLIFTQLSEPFFDRLAPVTIGLEWLQAG